MDRDIIFYHAPQSRALIVHWMLEEVGVPYRMQVLDLQANDQKKPEYLAINPLGKVPALAHGDNVITEAAAICCYLADTFPATELNVPIGDRRRGTYLKWLFFGPGCLEPAVIDRMFKRENPSPGSLGYGTFDLMVEVVANGVRQGPYLLGEQFTAADVVIGSALRWGMAVQAIPELPEFVAYTKRLNARPASQRVFERDRELTAGRGARA